MNSELYRLAEQLGELMVSRGLKLATAESCTGGWIAKAIVDVPGSSAWFDRGFVTYSNASKIQMLGVKKETIEKYGAVSEATAREMVAGALKNSEADIAVAVTGIAGPGGGTADKPVGLIFIAWGKRGQNCFIKQTHFKGDRSQIRQQTAFTALNEIKINL